MMSESKELWGHGIRELVGDVESEEEKEEQDKEEKKKGSTKREENKKTQRNGKMSEKESEDMTVEVLDLVDEIEDVGLESVWSEWKKEVIFDDDCKLNSKSKKKRKRRSSEIEQASERPTQYSSQWLTQNSGNISSSLRNNEKDTILWTAKYSPNFV